MQNQAGWSLGVSGHTLPCWLPTQGVRKTIAPLHGVLGKTESQAHGSGAVVGTQLSPEDEQVILAEMSESLFQQDLDNELKPPTLTSYLSCRLCLPPPRCPEDMKSSGAAQVGVL